MRIFLPQNVIDFTNKNWPELDEADGLQSVPFRVVDRLPFGGDWHAMAWRGEVLVRRGWIKPALGDLLPGNVINPIHVWAIESLAFHEPHHILAQRDRSWILYLLRYLWQWIVGGFSYREIAEEERAYEREAKLAEEYLKTLTGRYLKTRPYTG